jgi:hypothetical protein
VVRERFLESWMTANVLSEVLGIHPIALRTS